MHARKRRRRANRYCAAARSDYALVATSLISKTVGSFPTVSGVTSESSVGVPAFGDGGILGANECTLQINTNANSKTSVCSGGASGCTVWQQFIYATNYETKGSEAAFMQYWLLGYGTCPSGWSSDAGTTGETNNLNLGTCTATGGSTPSVQFKESLVSVQITLTVALTSVGGFLSNPVIFAIDGKSYGTITKDETVASITIQSGTAVNVTVTNAPLTGSEYPVCVLYSASGITVTSTDQPLVITGTASTTNATITVDCFGFGGD
jgi:hypothetical protein